MRWGRKEELHKGGRSCGTTGEGKRVCGKERRMQESDVLKRTNHSVRCQMFGIGGLRLALVMENITRRWPQMEEHIGETWEKRDIKPTSYFYPERDIANGQLASDSAKSRLVATFHDKTSLTSEQADQFVGSLELDTKLLAEHNAVDYSLFLVRITSQNKPTREATGVSGTSVMVMAEELGTSRHPPTVVANRSPLIQRQYSAFVS